MTRRGRRPRRAARADPGPRSRSGDVTGEVVRRKRTEWLEGGWRDDEAAVHLYDALRGMAHKALLEEHDPDLRLTDVANRTLEKLLKDRGAWDGRESFLIAASRTLRRVLVDLARERRAKRRRWMREALRETGFDRIVARAGSLEEFFEVDSVAGTFFRLHPRAERVFRAVAAGERDFDEVARIVGCSTGDVERALELACEWIEVGIAARSRRRGLARPVRP